MTADHRVLIVNLLQNGGYIESYPDFLKIINCRANSEFKQLSGNVNCRLINAAGINNVNFFYMRLNYEFDPAG